MSTDYRALCAELTDFLAELPFGTCEELVVRARAALAEPEPEDDVALLREALLATAAQRRAEDDARIALAADGPAVPEGREPASVVDQPSDEEIIQEAIKADLVYRPIDDEPHVFSGFVESHALNTYVLSFARAVLARWGHQPAPPAEGEVAELVAWLRGANWDRKRQTLASRAADLLAQCHPEPVPVAVSERLPEPKDLNDRGECWEWDPTSDAWVLLRPAGLIFRPGPWLPANALPVPSVEVQP